MGKRTKYREMVELKPIMDKDWYGRQKIQTYEIDNLASLTDIPLEVGSQWACDKHKNQLKYNGIKIYPDAPSFGYNGVNWNKGVIAFVFDDWRYRRTRRSIQIKDHKIDKDKFLLKLAEIIALKKESDKVKEETDNKEQQYRARQKVLEDAIGNNSNIIATSDKSIKISGDQSELLEIIKFYNERKK